MKKLIFACILFLFAAGVQAQEKAKPELSKEKKAELKKLKESHLTTSFTEVGLTEEQTLKARAVIEEAMKQSNALKTDTNSSDEEKKVKKEAINDEKNNKLKEILGDKYKPWQEIRKKQKAAEEEFVENASKQ